MRTDNFFSIVTTVTMSALLLFAVLFFSGCHQRSPEDRANGMIERITSKLDLDVSQKAYLQTVKEDMLAMKTEMQASRNKLKDELIVQIKNDTFDTTRLDGLMGQKKAEIEKMIQLFKDRMIIFHGTLSADQKEKLVELIESFQERHEKYWHGA